MNPPSRNWVQLCSHRFSAHDLSFPVSETQNPTITNERYKADEAQVNPQVAYQKSTYRWPSENRSLEVPPFHKFCWVSETSLQVYLPMPWIPFVQIYVMLDPWDNFLIILSTAKIILWASISGQNQKARDSSQLSHLLHYLTIIQWYQYINNICVHAC